MIKLEHWLDEGTLYVRATVYALETPNREEIQSVQRMLEETLNTPVELRLTVVPVVEFTVP